MGCKLTTTSGFCMPFDETGLHNETSQPLLVLKSFCLMFLHSDYMQFSSKLIQFCRSHKLYRLLAQPDRFILLEELRADKEMNCKMSYQCRDVDTTNKSEVRRGDETLQMHVQWAKTPMKKLNDLKKWLPVVMATTSNCYCYHIRLTSSNQTLSIDHKKKRKSWIFISLTWLFTYRLYDCRPS